jgi:hypothetical protein
MFHTVFVMYQLYEEGVRWDHVDAREPENNIPHARISRDLLLEQDRYILGGILHPAYL